MGFKYQLEREIVEEWRTRYLDYQKVKNLIEKSSNSATGANTENSRAYKGRSVRHNQNSHRHNQGQQQRQGSSDSTRSSLTVNTNDRNAAGHTNATQASAAERAPQRDGKTQEVFDCLDEQLEDVEDFYQDLLQQANSRYKLLEDQMTQLAEHRHEWEDLYKSVPSLVQPLLSIVRQLKERVFPETEEGAEQKKIFNSHYKREPHRFGAANRKLELALCEYYVYLGSISNYCQINKAGFDKCAKKIELDLGVPECRPTWRDKVHKVDFGHAYEIANLQTKTEMLYAENFERQHSPKLAAHILRAITRPGVAHSFATARAGLFLGMAIVMTALGTTNALNPKVGHLLPQRKSLLQIYSAFVLPVLLALSMGVNLVVWAHARIDIPVVFSFDRRTNIHRHSFFELPAFLLFTLSICFYASFSVWTWSRALPPTVWPMVWLVNSLAFLVNPLPYFHYHARWWLVRSTCRVFASGLIEVEFRDFFLGDQFCSLYYSVYNFYTFGCAYKHHFDANVSETCDANSTWITPVLASLPFIFRFGHSIRRYYNNPETHTHILNISKYALSIVYQFVYYNWRIKGSGGGPQFAWFIVAAAANGAASYAWDVGVDWNLLNRNAKHPLLRDHLTYSRPWVYYAAMLINLPLRFTWLLYLTPSPSSSFTGFLNSSLEVGRRCLWNFFRVEAEHLGNVDDFRAVRDCPLPYENKDMPRSTKRSDPLDQTSAGSAHISDDAESEDDDDGSDGSSDERSPLVARKDGNSYGTLSA